MVGGSVVVSWSVQRMMMTTTTMLWSRYWSDGTVPSVLEHSHVVENYIVVIVARETMVVRAPAFVVVVEVAWWDILASMFRPVPSGPVRPFAVENYIAAIVVVVDIMMHPSIVAVVVMDLDYNTATLPLVVVGVVVVPSSSASYRHHHSLVVAHMVVAVASSWTVVVAVDIPDKTSVEVVGAVVVVHVEIPAWFPTFASSLWWTPYWDYDLDYYDNSSSFALFHAVSVSLSLCLCLSDSLTL